MPTKKSSGNPERRAKTRFPLQRELRYKLLEETSVIEAGAGYTLNISSGGAAFCVDGELKPGAFIELSISWPVLLDDRCPMQLIVYGRILRSAGRRSACTIDRYEFRTQGRTFQAHSTVRNGSMLVRWADSWNKESAKMHAAV